MPTGRMTIPARPAAARALVAVAAEGRSLDDAVAAAREQVGHHEHPLLQELVYGSVRHWLRLAPLIDTFLKKPFKRRDQDLRALLVAAAYELDRMRTPPHAAVDAAVEAVGELGKDWARGLVNAVLRRIQRDRSVLAIPDDPVRSHAWPQWMAEAFAADWPDDLAAILASGTARAPMTLRVNRRHGTRVAYLDTLQAEGLDAAPHPHAPMALVLDRPVAVERLPGFAEGRVSVQDAAAQLAGPLLASSAGNRVLDACAAPGGKTAHLAELDPAPGELVALEVDAARAETLSTGLQRLGVEATVRVADAGEPDSWWDGRPFDRILLDAPCSGTGVVRRHPDIKLLRRQEDIERLADEQARLLDALWPLLAPGGMLLYATCSILRRENAEQVRAFADREDSAEIVPIEADWGRASDPGRQILPAEQGMDGFFYACLRRTA